MTVQKCVCLLLQAVTPLCGGRQDCLYPPARPRKPRPWRNIAILACPAPTEPSIPGVTSSQSKYYIQFARSLQKATATMGSGRPAGRPLTQHRMTQTSNNGLWSTRWTTIDSAQNDTNQQQWALVDPLDDH